MARINFDQDDGPRLEAGVYRARVQDCEEKNSRKGDPMFVVDLVAVDFDDMYLCKDYLVLSGRGAYMGLAKLKRILGKELDGEQEIQAAELIGRECYVLITYQTSADGQRAYRQVESHFEDPGHCRAGYWAESFPPENDSGHWTVRRPDVEDTPF